jgi:hypothetical protein
VYPTAPCQRLNYEDVGSLKQQRPRDPPTSAVEHIVNVDSNSGGESSDMSESEGLSGENWKSTKDSCEEYKINYSLCSVTFLVICNVLKSAFFSYIP